MKDESANLGGPAARATSAPGLPVAVDRAGHQCQCGRADAPSPSGRDSKLDALTS